MKNELSIFEESTSTTEALIEFAQGSSIKAFRDSCWPKECKELINKLRFKLGTNNLRIRVRKYLTFHGYDWK